MGTTTDKLNKLIQTKAAIKAALEEKGQNPSDVFSTYADNIKAIKDIPILDGTALPDNVLKGKTFYSDNPNEKLTGNIETFIPQNEYTSNQTLETSGKYLSGDIIINTPVKKDEQTKTVELNMSTGNQVITPDSNKVLTEVTINKPDTFIESNIKADISIGRITGTFTSDADAVASDIIKGKTAYVKGEQITGTIETFTPSKVTNNGTLQTNGKYVNGDIVVEVPSPTLNAPTISLSGSTLTITNPATNGSFVSGYDVYKNGTLLTSITLATVDLSTLITDSGTYTITVKAKGTNFNESPRSNEVNYTVTPAGGYTLTIVQEQSGGELKVTKFDGTQEWISETVSNVVSIDDVKYNGDYAKPYYLSPSISTPFTLTEDMTITIHSEPCFVEGTLITMANGTQKKVEDINYGDEVLCYDFNEGKQTTSPIEFVMKKMQSNFYYKVTLSDGTILKLVGANGKSHRLYNVTKQSFIYPQDFEENDYTLKENGTLVTISSIKKIFEPVNFYNIASNKHINVYAESVLTSNRLSNRFEIKDNKYTDKQIMTDEEIKAYKERLERLKK